jgi:regulatory protein
LRQRRFPSDAGSTDDHRARVAPKTLALRWLARREWSRAELAAKLRQRGVQDDEISALLDELTAAGYLSDARCAESLVAQRAGRYGKRAIAQALKDRGIGTEEARTALAPLAEADEFAQAQALWQQRFGTAPANEREKARQIRFLLTRGYGLSIALRVLRDCAS